MSAITKIFGTHSERELKRIYPLVDKVESYREAMGALSDEELKNSIIVCRLLVVSFSTRDVSLR